MLSNVVICAARRTPVGTFMGKLKDVPAAALGAQTIRAAVADAKLLPGDVQEVIVGQVLSALNGQNPARAAALSAGVPVTTPCMTINKVCGSGLKAVHLAAQAVALGERDIVACGGQESMSSSVFAAQVRGAKDTGLNARMGPVKVVQGRGPFNKKKGETEGAVVNVTLQDTMIADGLTCQFAKSHMGTTAENLVAKHALTRGEQDALALQSQRRATAAQEAGKFSAQIVPVTDPETGDSLLDHDEYIKTDASAEKLAELRPAFKKDGSVTAGNSSGINDGAAVLVVASREAALKRGLPILADIRGFHSAGVSPEVMGEGPIPAVEGLLKKVHWGKDEVDLWEANEAFASQALAVSAGLGLDSAKVNVNGGAIAIGHPIGASGARVLVDLVHELNRRGGGRGVATLCIGGGQGVAMAVEVGASSKL